MSDTTAEHDEPTSVKVDADCGSTASKVDAGNNDDCCSEATPVKVDANENAGPTSSMIETVRSEPVPVDAVELKVYSRVYGTAGENKARNKMNANDRNPITGIGLGTDGVFMRPKCHKSDRGSNPLTGEGYILDRRSFSKHSQNESPK